MDNVTINGFVFVKNEEDGVYKCRGDIFYDDNQEELPEPNLWKAALKLEEMLEQDGYTAEAEPSENGWVEVYYTKDK